MDKLPNDIVKAKKLFSDFEKLPPKIKKKKFLKTFKAASWLLDNYVKEKPHSPHLELISNLKKSNTRSLLICLKELPFEDYEDYYDWFQILFYLDKNIVNQILIENPELKDDYEIFSKLYADDLKRGYQRFLDWLEKE